MRAQGGMILVIHWERAHLVEISKGASATDLEHLWKTHALLLIEDVKRMGEFGENGWNYIATYFEELFQAGNQEK